ncbi:hypothetical protein [Membranihabitans marinus]|uniref:hypothetical protein n=1 Tax=Membranihabitans marinus TaxID=1227546 RepID=UPI001F1E7252|nr:hypothetical protein [Membranihabitans marinus]
MYNYFFLFLVLIFTACDKNQTSELSVQETDLKLLVEQLEEVDNLVDNQVCDNEADWQFRPIGSKACGGPAAYIPYSIKMDTATLFALVEKYTEAQRKYNIEYGVYDDCAVVTPPSSVICVDGKPELFYE